MRREIGIVLHVGDQFGVGVIGHNDGAGALDGAHDAGHAGCGADLQHILVADKGGRVLFDIMRAGPAGVPEQIGWFEEWLVRWVFGWCRWCRVGVLPYSGWDPTNLTRTVWPDSMECSEKVGGFSSG